MQTRKVRFGSVLMLVVGAGVLACSSDDSTAPGTGSAGSGGAGGTTGSAGQAGSGGAATTTGGGKAGSSGGGTGGSADGGPRDATGDCNTPGISHTAPTVPAAIATPSGTTLVGGYHASGNQIYTCVPAAADAGDGGVSGSWVNTATATLFGDNCAVAGAHSFAPGPTWTSTDGSSIMAARVATSPAPGATDAGATAIAWALLKASSNTGEGVFANVTYVQRTDTTGGVGPSGACDPTSDASTAKQVPYTATYYFYMGGNSSEAGTPDASDGNVASDASDGGGLLPDVGVDTGVNVSEAGINVDSALGD